MRLSGNRPNKRIACDGARRNKSLIALRSSNAAVWSADNKAVFAESSYRLSIGMMKRCAFHCASRKLLIDH